MTLHVGELGLFRYGKVNLLLPCYNIDLLLKLQFTSGNRTNIYLYMASLSRYISTCNLILQGGCRFVAAMLHFFFLGVFTWMLLEGVQLYRMVVLVFNATIRPLYLYLVGYGTPLAIVIISAIIRPKGYGTDQQ